LVIERSGVFLDFKLPSSIWKRRATLDAQRESAEAFIASQRHEGWLAPPQKYDDGGFTGANMEPPGLSRLLDDVRNGLVDWWWCTKWTG
jgi:DNA invertase Pin-like site-specific DNA recombinase